MLIPIRIARSAPARSESSAFSSASRRCMASAHRIARSGSSSCTIGAPNAATTASPMNFSTVPPNRRTSSAMASKNGRRTARRSSGSSRVESSVDAVRSANSIETTLRSSRSAGGSAIASAGASGVPQAPQKRFAIGLAVPQEGQRRCISDPHEPQKRLPSRFGAPHDGQSISDTCSDTWAGLSRAGVVPGGGVEPPSRAPKARVLPLDDPGPLSIMQCPGAGSRRLRLPRTRPRALGRAPGPARDRSPRIRSRSSRRRAHRPRAGAP